VKKEFYEKILRKGAFLRKQRFFKRKKNSNKTELMQVLIKLR